MRREAETGQVWVSVHATIIFGGNRGRVQVFDLCITVRAFCWEGSHAAQSIVGGWQADWEEGTGPGLQAVPQQKAHRSL